ncbi:MAG: pitrilysin family protein [Bacteroidota bacterium]|nr:pitrilysin family protein [Bacteroidota bacterium]
MSENKRSKAPAFAIPEQLYPIKPDLYQSSLGFPIYTISAGTEPVVRLDFIFQAGTRYQNELFISGCTNSLLTEGTHCRTGKEIAETIDFLGSYIYPFYDRDEAGITMYCLEKHLKKNLELVLEILQKPSFPPEEIEIFKAKKRQSLILDKQKPEHAAREHFLENIFGQKHPYGIHGKLEDLDVLEQEKLVSFHQTFYNPTNMKIILTSRDCTEHLPFLEEMLSGWKSSPMSRPFPKPVPPPENQRPDHHYIEVNQATQTSIRLGKVMPDRHHPDYPMLSIINTILGGYFGSRLMQNIRENKGYTYGIGSGLISFKEQTILTISSSVTSEVYADAIKECFLELKKLREELVPEKELSRVRNYLIGDLQRQLDGPFNIADTFKSLLFYGLDFTDLDKIQKTLFELNPENIRVLALKYLQEGDFLVIAAGPSK